MVAFPLVRVLDLADADDPEPAARDGRELVANRFAEDLLARRSAEAASRWVIPSLYDEVNSIVGDLDARSSAVLDRATTSVAAVRCVDVNVIGVEIECFHAWLRAPGAPEIIRIELDVALVGNELAIVGLRTVRVVHGPSAALQVPDQGGGSAPLSKESSSASAMPVKASRRRL